MTYKTRFTKVVSQFLFGAFVVATFVVGASSASAATLYRELQLGMSGADVSSLQTFLAQDSTIYPQGLVTGYFGSLTKAAVARFQTRNGIPSIGRVGPLTLAALNMQMGGDRNAPIISTVNVNTTDTTATLNWNTNENAAGLIYYDTTPLSLTEATPGGSIHISGSTLLVNTNLSTSHGGILTGLHSNTNYYYVVYARDGFGNESITWPATFRTTN